MSLIRPNTGSAMANATNGTVRTHVTVSRDALNSCSSRGRATLKTVTGNVVATMPPRAADRTKEGLEKRAGMAVTTGLPDLVCLVGAPGPPTAQAYTSCPPWPSCSPLRVSAGQLRYNPELMLTLAAGRQPVRLVNT